MSIASLISGTKAWEDPNHPRYGLSPYASPEARQARAARAAEQAVIVGEVITPTVPLPALVPGQTPAAFTPVTAPIPVVQRAGRGWRSLLWRYRVETAPVVAGAALVAGAAADPTATAAVAGTVATAAGAFATHGPETVRSRRWLSARERVSVAAGTTAGAGWSAGAAAGWWHADPAGVFALAGLIAPHVWSVVRGRRVRPVDVADDEDGPSEFSHEAAQLIEAWPHQIGDDDGLPVLRGSVILPETMEEPYEGTYAMDVRLGSGVHAASATGDDTRRYLETRLKLGHGMVQLETVRDDVSLLHVTITASRHLEKNDAPWLGPILNADGSIDYAVGNDGRSLYVHTYNDSGVEHFIVYGTTGTGKSYSAAALVLPGVCTRKEVLWYVDGGMGLSATHLARAADWWVVSGEADEICDAIEAAEAVMEGRKRRRRRSEWVMDEETDPILTLMFEEASKVLYMLRMAGTRGKKAQSSVELIVKEGRKFGVRIGQVNQDAAAETFIGGRVTKDIMASQGTQVGHRVGSATAAALVGSNAGDDKKDVRSLTGKSGFAVITRAGKTLAPEARIRFADKPLVGEVLEGFIPRALEGKDFDAAGDAYRDRVTGQAWYEKEMVDDAPEPETETEGVEEEPAPVVEETPASESADYAASRRDKVVQVLQESDHPILPAELSERTGIPRSTLNRHLTTLRNEGRIRRAGDGMAYEAVPAAV